MQPNIPQLRPFDRALLDNSGSVIGGCSIHNEYLDSLANCLTLPPNRIKRVANERSKVIDRDTDRQLYCRYQAHFAGTPLVIASGNHELLSESHTLSREGSPLTPV